MTLVIRPLMAMTAIWPETWTRFSTICTSSPGRICLGSLGNCWSCDNRFCASCRYSWKQRCESSGVAFALTGGGFAVGNLLVERVRFGLFLADALAGL